MICGRASEVVVSLLTALLANPSAARAHGGDGGEATPGFEPCHLLCTTDTGRTQPGAPPERRPHLVGLELRTAWLFVQGRWVDGRYQPLPDDASVVAVQILPAVWTRPVPWLRLEVAMPWEVNRATGVVLPTLHARDGTTSEVAPAGLFFAALGRVPLPEGWETEAWLGLGYRLSREDGTDDVSGTIQAHPDAAIEGLGVGSDDLTARSSIAHAPTRWHGISIGASLELRLHTWPRWQRHWGTTVAGRIWTRLPVSPLFALVGSIDGYETWLTRLSLVQRQLAVVRISLEWRPTAALSLSAGFAAAMPGTPLNENAIQWMAPTLGVAATL